MKYLALLLLPAGLCHAQDFSSGQAARIVIGQTTFTRQEPGTSASVVGSVGGLAYANGMLLVADANRIGAFGVNNRVLIYNDIASKLPRPTAELPSPPAARCQVCGGVADVVLGQSDFTKNEIALSQSGLRLPTAVATDGQRVAVADTDNNRVLIWNSIPTQNGQPADVVVGQTAFNASNINAGGGATPNARGFRGPQGVWIQNGKLYVADTQNNRVMIWNQIPTSNGAEANVVLGQASFSVGADPNLQFTLNPQPTNMVNPVAVSSDGTRLFVTDLGHNRILVWNTIPTRNQTPADFALGQPDVSSTTDRPADKANNTKLLCEPTGTNSSDNTPIYPARCAATLNFPRFAVSDGQRLFVADAGNSRVLIWNTMPTRNGQPADLVLGQRDFTSNDEGVVSPVTRESAADSLRTPLSLAWDGVNLYVSDPYNRRVVAFTVADVSFGRPEIRNAASQNIFAVGTVTVSGTVAENDEATIKIGGVDYKYKAVANDTITGVINGLVAAINKDAGDPLVIARPNIAIQGLVLTARKPGEEGNAVTLSTSVTPTTSALSLTASGSSLTGGQDAARLAPGSLINLRGVNFTDRTETAPETGQFLPTTLAGIQVYADGRRLPLLMASPTQITTQLPYEVFDTTSVSLFVRRQTADGNVQVSNAVGVPVVTTNPGLFAAEGTDPRPAVAMHGSSFAQGVISVDGSIKAGDVATITVEDRTYTYTVVAEDNLESVRDKLIQAINQDPRVLAYPASVYTQIRLQAREPGPDNNGITIAATVNSGASLILTALNTTLCCANTAGAPITDANPAVPGELIIVYGTGLGTLYGDNIDKVQTGMRWDGSGGVTITNPVDDALVGGRTARVQYVGLRPGSVGVYEVHLLLNSDLPTNPLTQLYIAQGFSVSNIVTIPLVNPKPPE
ncbi:MAG TPA: hypothetical protein VE621_08005 [Bryobacteraceae bacterium]|nr:hypothetical protein [Bryobacteraceae bacterium]